MGINQENQEGVKVEMRVNEYNDIDEFKSEFIGVWSPSDGHWFGLVFEYHGNAYRLHTGKMYAEEKDILPDGRELLFGLYKMKGELEYELLGQFATMDDLLESTVIENIPFREVIMADETLLTGQD